MSMAVRMLTISEAANAVIVDFLVITIKSRISKTPDHP